MASDVKFEMLDRFADTLHDGSIFLWLRTIGVVPEDVYFASPPRSYRSMRRDSINVGYLAGIAYEWDTWGKSTPREFVDAIECELEDSPKKDIISETLAFLGREVGLRKGGDV